MADEKLKFIHAAEDALDGFEGINASTVAIPFLKLAQELSPEVKVQKDAYIKDLKLGEFFNSTTKQIYGASFNFIVLKFERIYIEWKPNRGGFVEMHTPENAERIAADKTFGKWKTGAGNDLTEYYTYFGIIEGHEHEGVIVYSMSSTGIKVAKEWNKIMTTHYIDGNKRAMPYYLVFNISSKLKTSGQNEWYTPVIKFDHYINEEQYALITGERKALPNRSADYAQIEGPKTRSEDTSYEIGDDEL